MSTKIIHTGKGTIEFSMIGKGLPILFFHGGHSSSNETLFHKGFDPNRFCLITPSRPGYANTPLANNGSPKQTAELFRSMMDELKLTSAIVIGISAGGLSAIEFASNFPDRVEKLVLISAVTKKWMTDADKTYIKAKKLFSPTMEGFSWGLFRFFYSIFPKMMAKTMFEELSTYRPIDFTKEDVDELFDMIKLQRSYDGFMIDLDQMIDPNVILGITCPTLILHSSNDKSVDIVHARHAHSSIRHSILNTYNTKWGHLLWLGQESHLPINDTLDFIDS